MIVGMYRNLLSCVIEIAKLTVCATLLAAAAARVNCWRGRSQAFVDQHLHFDASIFCATFASFVIGNRIRFTKSVRRHNAAQWNLMTLNHVTNDGISATLA